MVQFGARGKVRRQQAGRGRNAKPAAVAPVKKKKSAAPAAKKRKPIFGGFRGK